MPRLRQPPLSVPLVAGALIAIIAFSSTYAIGQSTTATDSQLMRPALDGDPRNPPRFRRPKNAPQDSSDTGLTRGFSYQPAIGAGTTGFDSTNARRAKGKSGQKKATRTTSAQATGDPTPGQAAAPQTAAPPPTTISPAAARLPQNRQRPGAPLATSAFATTATTALITPPRRRPPTPEEDPFAPTGIQVGAFLMRPAIEATRAYDTNPARSSAATPSWYTVIAPELQANSNWGRHEMTANLRGSYTTYDSVPSLNRPNVDAKVTGRVDVTTNTRLDLETRFLVATDNPGSPNIQADLAKLPIYTTLGGTAGIGQRFNRFEVVVKGSADRTVYQQSNFTDGTTASNDDRNYNRYGTQLRTNYELTPGMKPFLELGADTRVHDLQFDSSGLQRDSNGRFVKVGTTFEYSQKLTGDVAVGYLTRQYKDPSLERLAGPTFDASFTWLASGLTTVKLTAKTSADESTVAGVSGVFTREVTLQVDHAFRRWLIATAKFTRAMDDYVGSPREDLRYAASGLLTYKLTREWQLKAEYRREWLTSNTAGNGYLANVYLLGVRWQR